MSAPSPTLLGGKSCCGFPILGSVLFLAATSAVCPLPGTSAPATEKAVVGRSLLEDRLERIQARQQMILQELAEATDSMRIGDLLGRLRAVVQDYESVIAANPEELVSLLLYGKLLREIGERERAHQIFLRANALAPEVAVVKQQIGNYYAEEGNHPLALACYLQAIELEPEVAVYHFGLGELLHLYRESFRRDGAFSDLQIDNLMLESFAQASRLAPGNPDYRLRWAESHYDLANPRWEDAESAWKVVLQHAAPGLETEVVHLHLARVHAEQGEMAEAESALSAVTHPSLEKSRTQVARMIETGGPLPPVSMPPPGAMGPDLPTPDPGSK